MVIIRLSRTGAKKRPFYHIVVKDSRSARDGRNIEQIGYFNPVARGNEVRLNIATERVQYWLSQGAQVSDRAKALWQQWLKAPQPIPAKDLPKKPVKVKKQPEVVATTEAGEGAAAA